MKDECKILRITPKEPLQVFSFHWQPFFSSLLSSFFLIPPYSITTLHTHVIYNFVETRTEGWREAIRGNASQQVPTTKNATFSKGDF